MNKWTPSKDPTTWLNEWVKQAEEHTKAKVTSYPVCNSLALLGVLFLSQNELSKLGQKTVMKAITLEMRLLDVVSGTCFGCPIDISANPVEGHRKPRIARKRFVRFLSSPKLFAAAMHLLERATNTSSSTIGLIIQSAVVYGKADSLFDKNKVCFWLPSFLSPGKIYQLLFYYVRPIPPAAVVAFLSGLQLPD
jgi:hypothetical protein